MTAHEQQVVRAGLASYIAEITATPWWSDREKLRRIREAIYKANAQGADVVLEARKSPLRRGR